MNNLFNTLFLPKVYDHASLPQDVTTAYTPLTGSLSKRISRLKGISSTNASDYYLVGKRKDWTYVAGVLYVFICSLLTLGWGFGLGLYFSKDLRQALSIRLHNQCIFVIQQRPVQPVTSPNRPSFTSTGGASLAALDLTTPFIPTPPLRYTRSSSLPNLHTLVEAKEESAESPPREPSDQVAPVQNLTALLDAAADTSADRIADLPSPLQNPTADALREVAPSGDEAAAPLVSTPAPSLPATHREEEAVRVDSSPLPASPPDSEAASLRRDSSHASALSTAMQAASSLAGAGFERVISLSQAVGAAARTIGGAFYTPASEAQRRELEAIEILLQESAASVPTPVINFLYYLIVKESPSYACGRANTHFDKELIDYCNSFYRYTDIFYTDLKLPFLFGTSHVYDREHYVEYFLAFLMGRSRGSEKENLYLFIDSLSEWLEAMKERIRTQGISYGDGRYYKLFLMMDSIEAALALLEMWIPSEEEVTKNLAALSDASLPMNKRRFQVALRLIGETCVNFFSTLHYYHISRTTEGVVRSEIGGVSGVYPALFAAPREIGYAKYPGSFKTQDLFRLLSFRPGTGMALILEYQRKYQESHRELSS